MLTVNDLRQAIAGLPDDMPVLIQGEMGTSDMPNLYVIPAHIDHSPYGVRVYEHHRQCDGENCTALLLSEWGHDDGVDITPECEPQVIDAEPARRELGSANA